MLEQKIHENKSGSHQPSFLQNFLSEIFYFTHVGPKNFYVFTGILSGPCRGERFLTHVIHVPLLLIFHSDQIYVILTSFILTKLLESQAMRKESHLFKVRSSVLL